MSDADDDKLFREELEGVAPLTAAAEPEPAVPRRPVAVAVAAGHPAAVAAAGYPAAE